jgi:hypothetical protein
MIFLSNLPRSRNDPSPFLGYRCQSLDHTILLFMSGMLSRTKIGLSLSPIVCPTCGLRLATCLRVQRVAIGATITKSDERPGCVASRA